MKNVLKKMFLISLAFVLIATMSACGDDKEVSKTKTTAESAETEVQSEKKEDATDYLEVEKSEDKKEKGTVINEKAEEPKTEKPVEKPSQKPSQEPSQEPTETTKEEVTAPTAEAARKYIGKSVNSLIAEIGQPTGKSYASSCIGDGEDGEWYYSGFTVYTYRDTNGSETVEDVF